MAHLHFTATGDYRRRVIQLGEHPDTVFTVGGLGIENINRLELLSREAFEESIDFKLKEKNLMITFHPATLEHASSEHQFRELLDALARQDDTALIFTMPNADTDGRIVKDMIHTFVQQHTGKAVAFESLGQLRYLSALQHVDGVVGNSSSGLIEAPSFHIGTINIGDRQQGRTKAQSVIDCLPDGASIQQALKTLYSESFQRALPMIENPYDLGNASEKICSILKNADLNNILKKTFYDDPGSNA
jgi:GDP/UDP-N,N'-diacetylbacillosamine 2-epimerase (hydrolysing)